MFESLSNKLQNAFRNLRGLGKISENNVTDALRDVRLALLEADVNFKVARISSNASKPSRSARKSSRASTRPADHQDHRRRTHRPARLAECRTQFRQEPDLHHDGRLAWRG
jgi:hypothetical protein